MNLQMADIRDIKWLIVAGVWFFVGDVLMMALIWRVRLAVRHGWLGDHGRDIGIDLTVRLSRYVLGSLSLTGVCIWLYCVQRPFEKYDGWIVIFGVALLLSRFLKFVRILGMHELENLHSSDNK